MIRSAMTIPTNPDATQPPPLGRLGAGGTLDPLCFERDEVAERAAQWCSSFKPCNAWEHWLVDRIAVESLRVERCSLQEMAMRAHLAGRAGLLWDDDRRLEALQVAQGMARAPEVAKVRLELSSHGCDWLIERWQMLRNAAETGAPWGEAHRALAFDLLGRAHELRGGGSDLPGDAAGQAGLARGEVARLEGRKSGLLGRLEAEARALAEAGVGPHIDRQLHALRRYEAQCLRRLEWAFAQFKQGRHAYRPEAGHPRGFDAGAFGAARPATDDRGPDIARDAGAEGPCRTNPGFGPVPGVPGDLARPQGVTAAGRGGHWTAFSGR